jgi:hypothetical protein
MRQPAIFAIAMVLAAPASLACAQGQTTVDVQLGPAVQAREGELGRDELQAEADYLRKGVAGALARSADSPSAVHLVIADIEPNRPTSAQLGASAGLRQSSFGLGGAAITGEVVERDGRTAPLRYRFFAPDLQTETNFTTWGDAEQAFDDVAGSLRRGRIPDDRSTWPVPHPPRTPTGTRIPR